LQFPQTNSHNKQGGGENNRFKEETASLNTVGSKRVGLSESNRFGKASAFLRSSGNTSPAGIIDPRFRESVSQSSEECNPPNLENYKIVGQRPPSIMDSEFQRRFFYEKKSQRIASRLFPSISALVCLRRSASIPNYQFGMRIRVE
jgi:hypothetical protein